MKSSEQVPAGEKERTAEIARRLRAFIKGSSRIVAEPMIDTLVATILSQNTSDVNSHRAYLQLRATYPTWDEVADADRAELADAIRIGGLADQKAATILTALRSIREQYGGFELPHIDDAGDDQLLAELTAIRGIGLKTAACVLMFSLGRDICAVDTHVHRVANRLGIVATSSADKTFHALRPLVPKGKGRRFHVDLIRFGRKICKAQRPHCFECPLFDLCRWPQKEEFAAAMRPGPLPVSGDFMLLDILRGKKPRGAHTPRSRG
jgi:endonuclease-3